MVHLSFAKLSHGGPSHVKPSRSAYAVVWGQEARKIVKLVGQAKRHSAHVRAHHKTEQETDIVLRSFGKSVNQLNAILGLNIRHITGE